MRILYDGDEALTIGVCGPGEELTAVVWGVRETHWIAEVNRNQGQLSRRQEARRNSAPRCTDDRTVRQNLHIPSYQRSSALLG